MSGPVLVAVVDPMGDLADTLARIEDWLRWCTPRRGEDGEDCLDRGVVAAAALAVAVRSFGRATVTADGVELAPVAVLAGDLSGAVAAIHAAARDVQEPCPPDADRALALVQRCCEQAASPEARMLGRAVRAQPGNRPVVLNGATVHSYRRLVKSVVTDPLERFAALPPSPPDSSPSPGMGW